MDIVNQVREKGIVGAGGAGFPTHVKLSSVAQLVIVNAAECEPLLHKDKEILENRTEVFLKGLSLTMEAVSADRAIIGIKEKHLELIDFLKTRIDDAIELFPLRDFYPAGDELTLIYETTGRVVEPGKLPISQGIIVNNVESIFNIGNEAPVTEKYLNVAGHVDRTNTLTVPIGISFKEVIDYARPTIDNYKVLVGGPMMGRIASDLSEPVTKTTAALIVLPEDHQLVTKYTTIDSKRTVDRIGKSACDQCTLCTELCPRYLLGHPIQPHKAMRALVFSDPTQQNILAETHTLYCCECNLCSFIACPEGLFPSTVCVNAKRLLTEEKISYQGDPASGPHPLADYRRTPSKKLKQMLDLNQFKDEGPLSDFAYRPAHLKVMLRQHIGVPAEPVVKTGDQVKKNQKLATAGSNLGSEIHCPADGRITEVTADYITVQVTTL